MTEGSAGVGRFWKRVNRKDPGGCWLWTGKPDARGQGRLWVLGKSQPAHRFSWELHHDDKATGRLVLQRCGNSLCVMPKHLFLATASEGAGYKHAKGCTPRGERAGKAKLTEEQVLKIRSASKEGASQVELAGVFKVTRQAIAMIIHRESWKHI